MEQKGKVQWKSIKVAENKQNIHGDETNSRENIEQPNMLREKKWHWITRPYKRLLTGHLCFETETAKIHVSTSRP